MQNAFNEQLQNYEIKFDRRSKKKKKGQEYAKLLIAKISSSSCITRLSTFVAQ